MKVMLYNTMGRKLQEFEPIRKGKVGMYCCGPTVYNFAHIGNLRTFIFEDVLKRTLKHAGYDVKHVMNITDVGHLTGDGDDGEDKLQKSSRETGRSVYEIADFYTKAFMKDYHSLNLTDPQVLCKATEHVSDMIALIKRLEKGGHTYIAGGNVYFSIDTFPDYGKLANLDMEGLREAVRDDVTVDTNKKNPKDFVLWFTNSKFSQTQEMMWDSPWGRGYPGWHIECSAMSMKYLGQSFDIHCGGIDAIPVHHTNEIAQSEAATGKTWVRYWLHGEFLLDEEGKMSKSKGEFLTLSLLQSKGYDPLDYRLFCLGAHYRSQLKFTYKSLDAARSARLNMVGRITDMLTDGAAKTEIKSEEAVAYRDAFDNHVCNDMDMPKAMSVVWTALRDDRLDISEKYTLMLYFDEILGLNIDRIEAAGIDDPEALKLVEMRTEAKKNRDWAEADRIRDQLAGLGYIVKDTPKGPVLQKKCN